MTCLTLLALATLTACGSSGGGQADSRAATTRPKTTTSSGRPSTTANTGGEGASSPAEVVEAFYHGLAVGNTAICQLLSPDATREFVSSAGAESCQSTVAAFDAGAGSEDRQLFQSVRVNHVTEVSPTKAEIADSDISPQDSSDPNPGPIIVEKIDGAWTITKLN
jgi:hypothetical protein